jgi:RNA-binding protein NOB1
MSWAALARKVKDVPVPDVVPQRVAAVDMNSNERAVKAGNVEQHTVITFNIPHPQKGCLVLDANAFIKGFDDFASTADVFVTVPQVVQEVKDRQSRELLERLPFELVVLDPTPQSVSKVVDIAQATGDLGTLSRTDIRLCALGLDLGRQFNALRAEIKPRGVQVNPKDVQVIDAEDQAEDEEEEEAEAGSDDDNASQQKAIDPAAAGEPMPGWGGSDDEGEWIKPDNMHQVKGFHVRGENDEEDEDQYNTEVYTSGFATVTSDFPMQNVLLHLGVPVVGPAGFMIRELRQWLLRCHACFRIVTDTTKQFCPDCGSGNTLKRVAYTITDDGEKKMFINFKHSISTRGTVYTLPKPRGGRNGTNRTLVLREDQLAHCGKVSDKARRRAAMASHGGGGDDDLKGFGERVERRSAVHLKDVSSYAKHNVNEKKKLRAARRK